MKKTVFVVTTLDSGGIENYLLRFLRYYEGKIKPVVICRGNYFGELEKEYRKIENIELIKINLSRFKFKSFYNFYLLLKNSNADSFVDFTGSYAGITIMLANISGIKIRNLFYRGSSHDFKTNFFKVLYVDMLKKIAFFNSTKILSNSIAALDFYFPNRSKKNIKYKVIYNGIDYNKLNSIKYNKIDFGIPEDSFVIGHTGRYNYAKNHDCILKVAEILCSKYNNIYFILCGKNTDIYLDNFVLENKILEGKVKILGYRPDVSSILTIFDIYFFPSITEGQPNSLIEAMVAGLPIVASNIKPILETTPEIIHGELISPLDVISFSNRLEEYYLSVEKRNKANFSCWARNNFSPSVKFEEFYKEL